MNAISMAYRFEPREPSRRVKGLVIVLALHALLGYALLSDMARKGLNLIKKPLVAVVIQEVMLPPTPPQSPQSPQSRKVKALEPLAPKVQTEQPPVQTELPGPSVIDPAAPARTETPATPKATDIVTAEPTPMPTLNSAVIQAASMEGEYASQVRAMLNATKRYPTGRAASQQRPQGQVKVWFTVARGGTLLEAGILESSNSNLLDDAAIATVRRAVFPPFPANTWFDQASHKFSADMAFSPPSA